MTEKGRVLTPLSNSLRDYSIEHETRNHDPVLEVLNIDISEQRRCSDVDDEAIFVLVLYEDDVVAETEVIQRRMSFREVFERHPIGQCRLDQHEGALHLEHEVRQLNAKLQQLEKHVAKLLDDKAEKQSNAKRQSWFICET